MSTTAPTRREILASSGAAGAISLLAEQMPQAAEGNNAIRPFHIDISEDALANLRRRIDGTQWPEKETVADQSQGVSLATMRSLARYWATDYDWRKCEA